MQYAVRKERVAAVPIRWGWFGGRGRPSGGWGPVRAGRRVGRCENAVKGGGGEGGGRMSAVRCGADGKWTWRSGSNGAAPVRRAWGGRRFGDAGGEVATVTHLGAVRPGWGDAHRGDPGPGGEERPHRVGVNWEVYGQWLPEWNRTFEIRDGCVLFD